MTYVRFNSILAQLDYKTYRRELESIGLFKNLKNKMVDWRDKPAIAYLDTILYKFINDNIIRTAGSLSYFLTLSIFPFLIALINIVQTTGIVDVGTIQGFMKFLPPYVADLFINFLKEVSHTTSTTVLSLSLLGGLWSASSGVKQMIRGINDSYHYKDSRNYIKISIISVFVTIGIILMIILLVVTQVFGKQVLMIIRSYVPPNKELSLLVKYFRLVIPLAYMFFMLLLLYKIAPADGLKNNIPLRAMIPGTIFSTVSIILVSLIFNIYVSSFSNYSVTYGSLAGIIVFLIWLFLFSMMILVGGLINSTYQLKITKGLEWPREESMIAKVMNSL